MKTAAILLALFLSAVAAQKGLVNSNKYHYCLAYGDPHYRTFDGVYLSRIFPWYTFGGAQRDGNYLLAGTCRQNDIPLKVFIQTGYNGMMSGVTLELFKNGEKIRIQFGHGRTGYFWGKRFVTGDRFTSEINGKNASESIPCKRCGITIRNAFPASYDRYGYGDWRLTSVDAKGKEQFTLRVRQTLIITYVNLKLSDDLFYDSVSGYCGNMNDEPKDDAKCHSSGLLYKDCWAEKQLNKKPDRNWAEAFKWPTKCPRKRSAKNGKARALTRSEKKRAGPANAKCALIADNKGPFKGCEKEARREFQEACVSDGTAVKDGHCGVFQALAAHCNLKPGALKSTGCDVD